MRKSIVDVQHGELHMAHDEVHKARVLASISVRKLSGNPEIINHDR
jgi:hypothetical protein